MRQEHEECPGCGCLPGDGITETCFHPEGCGYFKETSRVWRVRCEVWGGVTGRRTGYLKNNGDYLWFSSLKEAQEEATRMTLTSRSLGGTVNYRYTAEEAF